MKNRLKNFFQKNWQMVVVILLATLFFMGASSYNFFTQKDNFIKWASPDETANYTFTKLYAQAGELRIFEKYNLYAEDIIHPRSFRSDSGKMKPVSFLGIILIYGTIAKFTTYQIIPYLTPFLAGVGLIFFYLLVKQIYGKHNALISVFLAAFFPPYLYYSARSMFHNVLFLVMLIIGLYFWVIMVKKAYQKEKKQKWFCLNWRKLIRPAVAGFFIGLALITRTSELILVLPLFVVLWIFNLRKIGLVRMIIFLCFILAAFLPMFYYNQILYGKFYFGGYHNMNQSIVSLSQASIDLVTSTAHGNFQFISELLRKIKSIIFYFGFHPKEAGQVFYLYFIKMFGWLFWSAAMGMIVFWADWRGRKKRQWLYLLAFLVLSSILVIYYGSWKFHDNPDPDSATIGNSYTRYWLPIYFGAIPLAAFFMIRLTRAITSLLYLKMKPVSETAFYSLSARKHFVRAILRILIIIFISFYSLQFVLMGSEEGLIFTARNYDSSQAQWKKVINATENNSIIITQYHDKLFFPERKVIVGMFDSDPMIKEYSVLVNYLPVYYYNFTFPDKDFQYVNQKRLDKFNLILEKKQLITPDFTLYQLKKTIY